MDASIWNPFKCELHSVYAKVEHPMDIHKEIIFVYENIMHWQNIFKWCLAFSEDKSKVHGKKRSFVISDAPVQRMEVAIQANRHQQDTGSIHDNSL
ncbi:hypothetical protein NPIL_387571 [Nephila pilipes]|uniref:Uncharacterized protein n=1 Tax=Nephila pilipes TaxID=299642 RepID=A0A8X6N3U5_NEPPI|nr:hypothetical protein NPIL_387571 [Nephila pilipes]